MRRRSPPSAGWRACGSIPRFLQTSSWRGVIHSDTYILSYASHPADFVWHILLLRMMTPKEGEPVKWNGYQSVSRQLRGSGLFSLTCSYLLSFKHILAMLWKLRILSLFQFWQLVAMVYTIILSSLWREDAEAPAQLGPVEGTYVHKSNCIWVILIFHPLTSLK